MSMQLTLSALLERHLAERPNQIAFIEVNGKSALPNSTSCPENLLHGYLRKASVRVI